MFMETKVLPGWRRAVIELKCGHLIQTQKSMREHGVVKGTTLECPTCKIVSGVKCVRSSSWKV